jgi:hypothetical protein
MTATRTATRASAAGATLRKLGAVLLGAAALGLPINNIADYVALLILTVAVFVGTVSARPRAWAAAAVIVTIAVLGRLLIAPSPIEEGHNVFLPAPALEQALPADVYHELLAAFDAQYPPARRCDPKSFGCWRNGGMPETAFAFSADSIWRRSDYSRTVNALDFSDPVWLRLGFVNELRYNWTTDNEVKRATRDRRFWMGWDRWHLTMPWYEMIRVPADYAGGKLCWRGTLMWEAQGGHFSRWPGEGCRAIETGDIGRRIFGVAVVPDSLAMRLSPPWSVWLRQFFAGGLVLAGLIGLLAALVELRPRRMILPSMIIGLSILVVVIADASFLGGIRPFDGGDDGLFYDGVGRVILQKLMHGDVRGFLEGGERVFFYGGPGLRYFRAVEHIFFGESYLGYLSLVLAFPFVVYGLFRRFLSQAWALALILVFVAIPVGILFGTSYVQYEELASRGFADPAAYILFIAGLLPIIGRPEPGGRRFAPAFFGALLVALGICMKPIIAPAAAVLLGGAGLAALYMQQWKRLAGLCLGFLPVFSMTLHNWVFGHEFVLFSANAQVPIVFVMPPSAYAAATHELLTLNLRGEHLMQFFRQLADWLGGPAESHATIPLNAAGIAVLVHVVIRGRHFDPWLRLIGASALAQHSIALFYTAATARYHFLSWFLTMLVVAVWFERDGIELLKQRYPGLCERFIDFRWVRRLASGLDRLQRVSA